MLSPDARSVAMELLRPSPGYAIDRVVITTFSLDLEALLILPLAVLAHSDGGLEELISRPLLLMEGLREAGERIHVFVDQAGMAIPAQNRKLYSILEPVVHPVQTPVKGGRFHPKVWLARFRHEDGHVLLRVVVMSRNLTFDRSWDIALDTEGRPTQKSAVKQSKPLGKLLRWLPDMARGIEALSPEIEAELNELANQIDHTAFDAPPDFGGPVQFHDFGLHKRPRSAWKARSTGGSVLAIAPFANKTALDALKEITGKNRILVSRQDTLDAIPESVLAAWPQTLVLSDMAAGEATDVDHDRPSGLHAKMIAIEHGHDVTWWMGSANLTRAAFTGRNVEVMASITGRKGIATGHSGVGIERFKESGFLDMCEDYHRAEPTEKDPAEANALKRLDRIHRELVTAPLRIECSQADTGWQWRVHGELPDLESLTAHIWPVSIKESDARPLRVPMDWKLDTASITAFVAFRLSADMPGVDDIRWTQKLPITGVPEGRDAMVLRSLIDSPQRLLEFLRALLGGLGGLSDWMDQKPNGEGSGDWVVGFDTEALLEDLLRAAAHDPERLKPVRRLIEDLRASEEGRDIVPDDLYQLWNVVDAVIAPQETP